MNVLMLLKPKETVKYIYENNTLRQGLEKMRAHSYTAIPVISEDGKYRGTVSEGDFLYYILDMRTGKITDREKHRVRDIVRHDFNPAVRIDVSMREPELCAGGGRPRDVYRHRDAAGHYHCVYRQNRKGLTHRSQPYFSCLEL